MASRCALSYWTHPSKSVLHAFCAVQMLYGGSREMAWRGMYGRLYNNVGQGVAKIAGRP